MDPESQYRREVEYTYVSLLLAYLDHDCLDPDGEWLIQIRRRSPLGKQLDERQPALGIEPEAGLKIEREASQALLAYLQKAKQMRSSFGVAGLESLEDVLEWKREKLGLQPETAHILNTWLSRAPLKVPSAQPTCSERLRQHDDVLVVAPQGEGLPLQSMIRAELQRLQLWLGMASADVIMPEEIRSARQVDYTRLWWLLKSNQWQQANDETRRLMLQASGRHYTPWFSLLDLQTFPCVDLHTIDFLWMKFSNGRFGFSAQRQIWWQYRALDTFAERVDWLRGNVWITPAQLNFSMQARLGHLPALPLAATEWQRANVMEALMRRLDQCPLSSA